MVANGVHRLSEEDGCLVLDQLVQNVSAGRDFLRCQTRHLRLRKRSFLLLFEGWGLNNTLWRRREDTIRQRNYSVGDWD